MITRVSSVPAIAWPAGWEDVEVVDSVLVEEPPAIAAPRAARDRDAGAYDRFGRMAASGRCGRLVSVLA
jgi:hypothetical protein